MRDFSLAKNAPFFVAYMDAGKEREQEALNILPIARYCLQDVGNEREQERKRYLQYSPQMPHFYLTEIFTQTY